MLNDLEKISGWEPTDYSILAKLQSAFGPYHDLWNRCDAFLTLNLIQKGLADYLSHWETDPTRPFLTRMLVAAIAA